MKIRFKKIILIFILLVLIIFNFNFVYSENIEPSITASSAILIDNRTNKILFSKMKMKKCIQQAPQKY